MVYRLEALQVLLHGQAVILLQPTICWKGLSGKSSVHKHPYSFIDLSSYRRSETEIHISADNEKKLTFDSCAAWLSFIV
jgi:hypothetical protein